MKQLLNLQMSIFGSFDSIEVSPTLAADLIPLFNNELIPSVIQLTLVDPVKKITEDVSRPSMISADGKYVVAFLPDRIDCNFNSNNEIISFDGVTDVLSKLCAFLKIATQYVSAIGNRIAINGRYVTDDKPHSYESYTILPPFFTGKKVAEWSASGNAISEITINGNIESINNILNLSLTQNATSGKNGVMVTFDVNTVPTNTAPRFSKESLDEFLNQAIVNITEITSNM